MTFVAELLALHRIVAVALDQAEERGVAVDPRSRAALDAVEWHARAVAADPPNVARSFSHAVARDAAYAFDNAATRVEIAAFDATRDASLAALVDPLVDTATASGVVLEVVRVAQHRRDARVVLAGLADDLAVLARADVSKQRLRDVWDATLADAETVVARLAGAA